MEDAAQAVHEEVRREGFRDDAAVERMTDCNYCTLERLTRRAEREGKVVTIRQGDGGIYVYAHGKDESLDLRSWDDGNTQIVAWFAAVGVRCEC